MRLIIILLVLGVAFSHGAVVSQQGKLIDMVHSLGVDPRAFVSALGNSRIRRSTTGKAVDISIKGVDIELEYLDETRKSKGGKLVITISDFKKYSVYNPYNLKSLKFVIQLDVDHHIGDGFTFTVDYELHHYALETGKFTLKAESGPLKKIQCSNIVNGDNYRILPTFNVQLNSDYHSKFFANLTDGNDNKYEIKISQVPGSQLVISASGLGHTYGVQVDVDRLSNLVSAKLEQDGEVLVAGNMRYTLDFPKMIEVKAELLAKDVGKFDAKLSILSTDSPTIVIEARYNEKVIVAAKGKFILRADQFKAQLRYNVMGKGNGEGKIQLGATAADTDDGRKTDFMFHYLPNSRLDLKVNGEHITSKGKCSEFDESTTLVVTMNEEVYLKYERKVGQTLSCPEPPSKFHFIAESNFHVSKKSMFHCALGCFTDRTLKSEISGDSHDFLKFSYMLESIRDGNQDLLIEVKTVDNPYLFKMVAPKILAKLIGQDSFQLEVDFVPNEHLIIKPTPPFFEPFVIKKTGKTYVAYEVAVGDKVLAKGPISFHNDKIEADLILFNKEVLKFSLWQDSSMWIRNFIDGRIKYGTMVDIRKLNIDWDFSDWAWDDDYTLQIIIEGSVLGRAIDIALEAPEIRTMKIVI